MSKNILFLFTPSLSFSFSLLQISLGSVCCSAERLGEVRRGDSNGHDRTDVSTKVFRSPSSFPFFSFLPFPFFSLFPYLRSSLPCSPSFPSLLFSIPLSSLSFPSHRFLPFSSLSPLPFFFLISFLCSRKDVTIKFACTSPGCVSMEVKVGHKFSLLFASYSSFASSYSSFSFLFFIHLVVIILFPP